jgi:hypothetical protein
VYKIFSTSHSVFSIGHKKFSISLYTPGLVPIWFHPPGSPKKGLLMLKEIIESVVAAFGLAMIGVAILLIFLR